MILRELEFKDAQAFEKMLVEWEDSSQFNMLYGLIAGMDFGAYLALMEDLRDGKNLKENEVPVTGLYAFVGDEIVGKVSVRHYLNNHLEKVSGHIGYGVLEKHRGGGYASQILKQSLVYARGLGLKKVLITCDIDNFASAAVIMKNGGVLEGISEKKKRFWIELAAS